MQTPATGTVDGVGTYTWKTTGYRYSSFNATPRKTGHSYSNRMGTICCTDDLDYFKNDLVGNINSDGRVNIADVAKLYAHIRGTSKLF